MKRRAFTIMEIMIVILLSTFALLTMLTVYTTYNRHGTMSRARILAAVVCESMAAELRDHPYGTPMPPSWNRVWEVPTVVQGRYVQTTFNVTTETPRGGNGSFFNPDVDQSTDQVLVRVRWVEGTDASGAQAKKELVFDIPVKREPNLGGP